MAQITTENVFTLQEAKEMGVVETIRFLNQFSTGHGNYTKDRSEWLDKMTLDDAIAKIKSGKQTVRPFGCPSGRSQATPLNSNGI